MKHGEGRPSPGGHGQDVPVEAGKFMIQGFLMKNPFDTFSRCESCWVGYFLAHVNRV